MCGWKVNPALKGLKNVTAILAKIKKRRGKTIKVLLIFEDIFLILTFIYHCTLYI